jgi:hypothetical protein
VVLFTVGHAKTSTNDVTESSLQSLFSKSKTATVSVATPILNGQILGSTPISLLVIFVPCCLIFLAKGTFLTNEQARRYTVATAMGLALLEVKVGS